MHKFGSICSGVIAKNCLLDFTHAGNDVSFFQKWKSKRLCWSRSDPLKGIMGLVSWKKGALIILHSINYKIYKYWSVNNHASQAGGGMKTTDMFMHK